VKIAKSSLIEIINEEIENILNEGYWSGSGSSNKDPNADDDDLIDRERRARKNWDRYRKPYRSSTPIPIKVGGGLNDTTKKYKERIEAYLRDVTYDKFLDGVVTNHIIRDKKNISGPQMRVADKIMGLDPG